MLGIIVNNEILVLQMMASPEVSLQMIASGAKVFQTPRISSSQSGLIIFGTIMIITSQSGPRFGLCRKEYEEVLLP